MKVDMNNVPRVQIESAAEFVIYCEGEVVSEHNNEGDVMKAFAEHLRKHRDSVKAEPAI